MSDNVRTDPSDDPATTRWAICQKWEESEANWGVRSDGYSLHLGEDDRKRFVAEYWDSMPDSTPAEYSRPSGEPYRCIVDKKTFTALRTTGSIRRYSNADLPGATP